MVEGSTFDHETVFDYKTVDITQWLCSQIRCCERRNGVMVEGALMVEGSTFDHETV